jgi:two-component system, LuxR family, sensor kinase FixL
MSKDRDGAAPPRGADVPYEDYLDRDARHVLASIVEHSRDAIFSVGLDGNMTSWNGAAEQIFGYSAAEAVGAPLSILVPPERAAKTRRILKRVFRDEQVENYEALCLHKLGALIDVQVTTSPIRDGGGRVVGASKIVHDITARKREQQELQGLQCEMAQLQRLNALGVMSSSFAHELNQPLTAAMNFIRAAQHIRADGGNAARSAGYLDQAVDEIKMCGSIIRSLREFIAKRKDGRSEEDLNATLLDGLKLSLLSWTEGERSLTKELAADLPPVRIDKVQIQQVVLNLVRNASESVQKAGGGTIQLATRRRGDAIEVSIADTGEGISPEIADRLFKPFATTKKSGMGVGLSICRSIIEAHGGKIWAGPNTPRGAVFRFSLPAAGKDDA